MMRCVGSRHTCENVMRVLRSNKDSVMAMLEAFVHDPLINWRLLNTNEGDPASALAGQADNNGAPSAIMLVPKHGIICLVLK